MSAKLPVQRFLTARLSWQPSAGDDEERCTWQYCSRKLKSDAAHDLDTFPIARADARSSQEADREADVEADADADAKLPQ